MAKVKTNKDLQFLKSMIKDARTGKRLKVSYSKGSYTKESGLPQGTITIYSREYSDRLPKELKPENNTDLMTDYFEKDTARVKPNNKYYKDVLKALKKQEDFNKKILAKRKAKYGWD